MKDLVVLDLANQLSVMMVQSATWYLKSDYKILGWRQKGNLATK